MIHVTPSQDNAISSIVGNIQCSKKSKPPNSWR